MKWIISILMTLTLMGCASQSAVQELGTKHVVLKGTLSAPPELEENNKRLWLYLKVEVEAEGEDAEVIVCLASNKENKRVLIQTKDRLLRVVNEPVFIYATKETQPYEEIVDGVDYHVAAIGYYVPEARKYRIVTTTYGDGLRDAMKDLEYKDFFKMVGKAAFKAIKP